jgi:hypothetical protein
VLFEIQGSISTLGDHIVNVDCIISSRWSVSELFYGKQAMFACMPLLTALVAFIFWFVYGICKRTPFFAKRANDRVKTPKDKFIVTVTVIIFLMYTTLCQQAFSMFSCKWVGITQYLEVDLEEPCYAGRHLSMVLTLGIPQLVVYVVGLPAIVLHFLRQNRPQSSVGANTNSRNQRLEARGGLFYKPVVVTRWGLFFKR